MRERKPRTDDVESRTLFVEEAGLEADSVLDDIRERLEAAELRGLTVRWSEGNSLLIGSDRFPDQRQRVQARPFGIHLELEHSVTVEPPFLKRQLAWLLTGNSRSWSRPRGHHEARELQALLSLVQHAMARAAKDLAERVSADPSLRRLDLDDVLENW
jgi:hypothetical protein